MTQGPMDMGKLNFAEFLDSAEAFETSMRNAQSDLEKAIVTGRSADNTVVVMASGLGKLKAVRVDPKVFDARDAEGLQTAIAQAIQAAADNAGKLAQQKMGPIEITLH
ncbi:YbaB/EbfC family nucleoid-associated protein [Symbioplanes lichenis]|uniref:YbaB/EbfC family nucleoid-associated protein n=1 Tax=Symbioplanes lichenis TaxID=1629072 RepID=UPI002739F9A9|nr:YbaB/EbfC family nucleoid-associated protein [Actinoplanes lichenis]